MNIVDQIFNKNRVIRSSMLSLAVISIASVLQCVHANPTGATVTHGQVTLSNPNSQTLIVNQATDRAIINWDDFSILQNETTQFVQPDATSMALNRVTGGNVSEIYGNLVANGQIILINPQGIHFGPSARVDVAGVMASTLNLSDTDFLNNNFRFQHVPGTRGAVVNHGTITARDHGLVALIGPGAANHGVIAARLGTVAMGAGKEVVLDFYGDQLINFAVTEPTDEKAIDLMGAELPDAIRNTGHLMADGGQVLLSAAAVENVVDNVINMSGYAQADSVEQKGGKIILDGGDTGWTHVHDATLHARGLDEGELGGEVKVLGNRIALLADVDVDVSGFDGGGTLLVGGNFQGAGPERNAYGTYIGEDVALKADALNEGDGGRIIVWADETTFYYGDLSAKGGPSGGDGGFAEVSGKQNLAYYGEADLTAPHGVTGTLLLDPDDVVIDLDSDADGDDNGGNANVLDPTNISFGTDSGSDWTIYGSEIEGSSATSAIIIRANGSIEFDGSGTLTVDDDFTLIANNDVDTNSAVIVVNGDFYGESLNQDFNIGNDITANGGNIEIRAGQDITSTSGDNLQTSGGDITLIAGRDIDQTGNLLSDGGDILISLGRDYMHPAQATIDADGGDISIFAGGTITIEDGDVRSDLTGSENTSIVLSSQDLILTGSPATNVIRADVIHLIPLDGDTVDLGGAGSADYTLTSADMDFFDAGEYLQIGSLTTGDVTFTSPIDMLNADNLRIQSGGTINDTGGGVFFTGNRVAFQANLGVGTSGPVGIDVARLSGRTDSGGIDIQNFSTNLTVNNNGNPGLLVDNSGGITLQSAGTINLTGNLEAPGNITVTVDDTALANGEDFNQLGGYIQSHNGSITLRIGDDINLTSGDLVEAAGAITLIGDYNDADAAGSTIVIGAGNVNSGTNTINVTTGNDDDTLHIANINNINSDVNFSAGSLGGDNDLLSITSGSATTVTHTFDDQFTGSADFDGRTVDYTGLESMEDLVVATTREFLFSSVDDTITLDNASSAGDMVISSAGTSVPVTFTNPSSALTIDSGSGADTLNLVAVDGAFGANLTLNGNNGADIFNITASTIGAGTLIVDGANGNDTLVGPNVVNNWDVVSSNQGDLNNLANFVSMENLTGGNNSDTFDFSNGAGVTGTINGGGGTDTLNYSAYLSSVVVDLGANAATNVGTVLNFENINGGSSSDTLTGNNQANVINGNGDDDVIRGASGNDTLNGGGGADDIAGQAGNDTVNGNGGNDTLDGGADTDIVNGNGGDDLILLTSLDTIDGGDGNDTLQGNNTNTTWVVSGTNSGSVDTSTFTSVENLFAGTQNDTFAFTGTGSLSGNIDGNDADMDTLDFSGYDSAVTVDLSNNSASTVGGTVINVENVVGSSHNDTLTGDGNANMIDGGAGADVINGLAGNDILNGNGGSDTINGGGDNDVIDGGNGNDILNGNNGQDNIQGGSGDDTISGGNDDDILNGGDDDDVINGNAGNDTLNGNAGNDMLDGGAGTDTVNGNADDDLIVLTSLDTINGGGGDDTLQGNNTDTTWVVSGTNSGSVDTSTFTNVENLFAGTQNDTFAFTGTGSLSGNIDGNDADMDTLDFSGYDSAVTVDLSNNSASTVGGAVINVENIVGSSHNDTLTGDGNANVIDGGAGADVINGLAGDDTLNGNGGNDTLDGGAGSDAVNGNDGDDLIVLTSLDTINGGGGDDTLQGNNTDTTWVVSGTNSGSVDTSTFTNVENLFAGTENDTFAFTGTGTLSGNIDGNDADMDTLDFSGYDSAVTVDLSNNSASTVGGAVINVENIVGSSHNDTLTGDGNANVIDGGAGADVINGLAGDDTLNGNGGNDTLDGGAGSDAVNGNGGDDLIVLTSLDTINGGGGDDTLQGNNTDTTWVVSGTNSGSVDTSTFTNVENLFAGTQNDTFAFTGTGSLSGNIDGNDADMDTLDFSGYDSAVTVDLSNNSASTVGGAVINVENIVGSSHNDTLTGDGNANVIDGGAGADVINGLAGDDTLNGNGGNDTLDGGAGSDAVNGNGGDDLIVLTSLDTINGGGGDDTLQGNNTDTTWVVSGTNSGSVDTSTFTNVENLFAGTENDTFAFTGTGTLSGNIDGNDADMDTLDFSGYDSAVTVDLSNNSASTVGGAVINVENIVGSSHNDTLTGDGNANVIDGGAGADVINGLAGDDTLNGNGGNDIISGGDGVDTINGNEGDDILVGGGGDDTINGGDGNDSIDGSGGDDTLNGEDGEDTVVGGNGADTISGGSDNDTIDGGNGTDTINGNGGNDTLDGGADNDIIFGNGGNDLINGGDGNDHLEGNNGNDNINGGDGDDTLLGQAGDDKLDGGLGDDFIDGGAGNDIICDLDGGDDTIDGGDGDDDIQGGPGDDVIDGGDGNDDIDGGDGDDTIDGGEGDDTVNGGDGDDNIDGGNGDDTLNGDEGDDTIQGGDGEDTISGGEGDDTLLGGDDDDIINGNDGDDTIDGQGDDDTVFGNDGDDVIDVSDGDDTVDGGSGEDDIVGIGFDDEVIDSDDDQDNYFFDSEVGFAIDQFGSLTDSKHDIYDGSLDHRFSNNSHNPDASKQRYPDRFLFLFWDGHGDNDFFL